jgi:hypothetical protein
MNTLCQIREQRVSRGKRLGGSAEYRRQAKRKQLGFFMTFCLKAKARIEP